MLAALQAPVIMMSQNRQDAKDRVRSEADYRVNVRAMVEIAELHEKLDRLRGELKLAADGRAARRYGGAAAYGVTDLERLDERQLAQLGLDRACGRRRRRW